MVVGSQRRAPVARVGVLARVGGFALAGLVGVAGLAGCRGDEGEAWDESVAAYVGEVAITEAEIDAVVVDLRDDLGAEIEAELDRLADELDPQELAEREQRRYGELRDQLEVTRTRMIEMRILTEAATAYAEAEGLAVPDPSIEFQAGELGLGTDSAYVRLVAEFYAALSVLQVESEPVAPTEADQREVYDNLVAEGLTTASFEEAQAVLTQEVIGEQVGLRNLMAEAVERADVRVSPRYDLVYRVPVPLGSGESWLALPLR
jgi:hypothetical protein